MLRLIVLVPFVVKLIDFTFDSSLPSCCAVTVVSDSLSNCLPLMLKHHTNLHLMC